MSVLYLIRHGENDYLKDGVLIGKMLGVHLNQRGKLQAMAVADELQNHYIEKVYSSPLERCIETAQPLANALNKNIIIDSDLADTDVGEWAGQKISLLRKLPGWKMLQEHPSTFRFPGGDSIVDVQTRMVKVIQNIHLHHKNNQQVAIFFHADPIKIVISHFLGLSIDRFQRIRVDTGSISIMEFHKKDAFIVAINWIPKRIV